jgi:hypothetical protein
LGNKCLLICHERAFSKGLCATGSQGCAVSHSAIALMRFSAILQVGGLIWAC